MGERHLNVALVTDVFFDDPSGERLRARLRAAKESGAELAVLPELPLNPWSPARRERRDEDAEPPDGPRQRLMSAAAREVGTALLGGVILRDPESGRRRNIALLFDASGKLRTAYAKLHLPEEEGFWETEHYEPGAELPAVTDALGMPLGIQICSDVNRPEVSHLLAALGAEAILSPRATPAPTFERWRLVMRATAVTSCAYVVSVNRPGPEAGVPLAGPSLAIGPDGRVLVETTDPVAVLTLERAAVRAARREYPGYLPILADLYAEGWRLAASRRAISVIRARW